MLVKRKWIITLAITLVLAGAYTGHRLAQAADAAEPAIFAPGGVPQGAPVTGGAVPAASGQDRPVSHADTPSLASSSTLTGVFHDAQKCRAAATTLSINQTAAERCEQKKGDAEGYRLCSAEVASRAGAVRSATARQASCTADPVTLDRQYYQAVDAAAKAGDVDAQVCFANGIFSLTNKDEIDRYVTDARAYLQAGLVRGDWRVVALLATPVESLNHGGAGMMAGLPMMGSQFTAYRASRLLQYGAKGDYAASVKQDASDAARDLTPAQVANANAWAAQEYQRYFSKAPALEAAPVPCPVPSN